VTREGANQMPLEQLLIRNTAGELYALLNASDVIPLPPWMSLCGLSGVLLWGVSAFLPRYISILRH